MFIIESTFSILLLSIVNKSLTEVNLSLLRVLETSKKIQSLGYYRRENTFFGKYEDVEFIMDKLNEIFDPITAHLCTKEELKTFIDNKWVFVYKEAEEILKNVSTAAIDHIEAVGGTAVLKRENK